MKVTDKLRDKNVPPTRSDQEATPAQSGQDAPAVQSAPTATPAQPGQEAPPAQPGQDATPAQGDGGNGDGDDDGVEEIPAPEQPLDVELRTSDAGLTVTPVAVRDVDVEVSDDALPAREPGRNPDAPPPGDNPAIAGRGINPEDYEGDAIGGEQVEYLQAAIGSHGCVLLLNGQGFAFNKGMTAALKQTVDKAVVGLSL